jgi:predicted DNA-binding transcriptional regulator YafY
VLEAGLDLPPLMLTQDEIEAAVLGAQWVARHSDPILARAAEDLIAKIGAVVPERLRPYVLEPATDTPPVRDLAADGLDRHGCAPRSMRAGEIALCYCDEQGRETRRTVWPVIVGYLETVRHLIAWCELRQRFRSFRTDRVTAGFLDERYPERPAACGQNGGALSSPGRVSSETLKLNGRAQVPIKTPTLLRRYRGQVMPP